MGVLKMKKTYLLAFILIIACTKNDTESKPEYTGIIEGFLNKDPQIVVEPIQSDNQSYYSTNSTKRGYIFKPSVDIEMTAIGGRMAKTGEYEIELFELGDQPYSWIYQNDTPILKKKVKITNTTAFQFTELDNKLLLNANKRYILRYFDESHASVYDVVLPNRYQEENYLFHPQKISDIELEAMYFAYYRKQGENYVYATDGTSKSSILFLRGIPDFTYVVKE